MSYKEIVKSIDEIDPLVRLSLIDLSNSRIETLMGDWGCEAKYFYNYVVKEKDEAGPPALLGNVIHKVLENKLDNDQPVVLQGLTNEYRAQLAIYDPEETIDGDLRQLGFVMIEDFYELHKDGFSTKVPSSKKILDKEQAFEIVIGRARMRGFIDRVDEFEDRIEIVDYKAQPLYTPILTPTGWTKMGDLSVGDYVIGGDGKSVKITGVYPQGTIPAYRVQFTDGSSTVCSDEHLWTVREINKYDWKTEPLNNLFNLRKGRNYRYAIPTVKPVEFDRIDLKVNPYIMGVILGDGGTTSGQIKIHAEDQEILYRMEEFMHEDYTLKYDWINTTRISRKVSAGNKPNMYVQAFRDYNLMGLRSDEKFIPDDYFLGSVEERKQLLAGLMDTDGGCSTRCEFRTTSPYLRDGVIELCRSLGGTPTYSNHPSSYTKDGARVECKEYYVINTRTPFNPFFLTRKINQWVEPKASLDKRIKSIDRIMDVPMQCIMVENEDGLYVTENYIVTHNTGKHEYPLKHIAKNLQLGLYALAMKNKYPNKDVHASLYYLRSGKIKGHLFSDGDLDRVVQTVLDVTDKINGITNFKTTANKRICKYCTHAKSGICKTGAAVLRT